ncbi:DUF134 domain-containing protein [Patescibacteria group bacterium]|nr:DUF134 domain-containing protein [Patescibacteria group bacterium]MBU1758456.1 DUF134 domain-containing protein [Patescibacteria group bacterium]
MARTKKERCVKCAPRCVLFKPGSVLTKDLEVITLELDEYEAMRLADKDGLTMELASKKMKISPSTFCRILASARMKVADALISTKGIQICSK